MYIILHKLTGQQFEGFPFSQKCFFLCPMLVLSNMIVLFSNFFQVISSFLRILHSNQKKVQHLPISDCKRGSWPTDFFCIIFDKYVFKLCFSTKSFAKLNCRICELIGILHVLLCKKCKK